MLINFSKIFEKNIKTRLIDFLEKNSLLSKNQYGFRPSLSTDNALIVCIKSLNFCVVI